MVNARSGFDFPKVSIKAILKRITYLQLLNTEDHTNGDEGTNDILA